MSEEEVLRQIHQLEAEADALRIERERAEMQAQEARHLAEQQAIMEELRAKERAEQEEFLLLQEEQNRKILAWRVNPFAYIEDHGGWPD